MKNTCRSLIFFALSFSLSGCATLFKPSVETLNKLPVIEFGETAPAHQEYILHLPSGKPIPMVASVLGTALVKADEKTLKVSLKKDIYAYKDWVSFDRKTWQKANEALNINVDIRVPSPEYPNPGAMKIQVDFK